MNNELLKLRVKGEVTFVCYQQDYFTYKTCDGFQFPIHVKECGEGIFLPSDKGVFFMRWIRQHMQEVEDAQKNQSSKA